MYKSAIIPSRYLGNKVNKRVLPPPRPRCYMFTSNIEALLVLHLSHCNPYRNGHCSEFYHQN